MVYQFAIDISKSTNNIYLLYDIISQERKYRISKYAFKKDKDRSILAEALLRYVLEKEYGLKNEEIKIGLGAYNKPYLINAEDIFFNLSHSGKWIYCGIGDNELGVDVEIIDNNYIEIARRFFAKSEYQYICQQSPENQKDFFYKFWTLKESYVKAVGKGLYIDFNSFCFKIENNNIKLIVDGNLQTAYQFISCKLDSEYWRALCVHDSRKIDFNNSLNKIEIQQLIDFYA